MPTPAYAAFDGSAPLKPHTIERRTPRATDVAIDILHCGVCHSDIHLARSEWFPGAYPMVPGHEIVGRVTAVGKDVTRFKVGDMVGVGCLVDSCRSCASCNEGLEQYCTGGLVPTYGAPDSVSGGMTYGGYSTDIVVEQRFVVRVPDSLDPAAAAPLLCAGITTYSPLRYWNVDGGTRLGVVGLGGLGHMAIQLAAAMGAEVTMFTRSAEKAADAKALGAAHTVLTGDDKAMEAAAGSFDLILNTVSAPIDLNPYMNILRRDGTIVMLGMPPEGIPPIASVPLVFGRKRVAGSLIGGLPETQEMLDFCGEHGVASKIEPIAMAEINAAWDRMMSSDVKYRFVIDMATMPTGGV